MNNATKVTDPRKGMIHGTIVSRILSLLSIIYSWYYVVNFYILIYNYGTIQAMHTDKLGVAWGRGYGCGVKLNFGTVILSPT